MTAGNSSRFGRANRSAWVAWILRLVPLLVWTTSVVAEEPLRLRRALAPADRRQDWPSGSWELVSRADLIEFERSALAERRSDPAPRIERLVFRGRYVSPALMEGEFEADTRTLSGDSEFLELGDVTAAVGNLQWTDGPAVWGTAPSGSAVLLADRSSGRLRGDWALRGEPVIDGNEFDFVAFPAASTRLELEIPDSYELHASTGGGLTPGPATDGRRLWVIELGQTSDCLYRVTPARSQPDAATLTAERMIHYIVRPDGARLQAEFNISAPSSRSDSVRFTVGSGLKNIEVTGAANNRLPVTSEEAAGRFDLSVALPELTSGRLGIVRVSGDLEFVEGEDWALPDVHLQRSTILSSQRNLHVEHPLTVQSSTLHDVRQTGVVIGETHGNWLFEDYAEEARTIVRIGRFTSAVTLRAVTTLEHSEGETLFRTAAEFRCRGAGTYRLPLRLPAGWDVVDVAPRTGGDPIVSAWRTSLVDGAPQLVIELREPLIGRVPQQLLITGRRTDGASGLRDIELFPSLVNLNGNDRSHVLVGMAAEETLRLIPQDGVRSIPASELADAWSPLVALLGVDLAKRRIEWFAQSSGAPLGRVALQRPTAKPDVPQRVGRGLPVDGNEFVNAPLVVDLYLESDIAGRGAQWHQHRAVYQVSGRIPEPPPSIRLPDGARIDSVRVDGRPQSVASAGDAFAQLDWSSSPRRVEILYRSPCNQQAGWLTRQLRIPLAEWSVAPHLFEWRIRLPRTETLSGIRFPWSTVAPRPKIGWRQRLFGLLARDDWASDDAVQPVSGQVPRIVDAGDVRPHSGTEVTISALHPAAVLEIDVTDGDHASRAGWLALMGAWLIAVLIRLSIARGVILMWTITSVLVVAALLLPSAFGQVCGNAILGILLGSLLPRTWLTGGTLKVEGRRSDTALSAAAAGSLLLVCCLFGSSSAQDREASGLNQTRAEVSEATEEFDVLLPLSDDGALRDAAWIQRRLLPTFNAWRNQRVQRPSSLLQSARYEFTAEDVPLLRASFDVAVFDRSIPLKLNFSRLWVADPDDCRVDGQPVQIRPAANSPDLLLDLSRVQPSDSRVTACRVELTLQPSAAARDGDGWRFDVPPVLDSTLSVPVANDPARQLAARSHRAAAEDEQGRQEFEIGGTRTISIAPGSADPSGRDRDGIVVDAVSLVELHPLRVRVRTQLVPKQSLEASSTSAVRRWRLRLPGRADVREVALSGLRRYTVRYPSADVTQVDLELTRAPTVGSSVFIDFSVPARREDGDVAVPPLRYVGDDALLTHRIGLRAAVGVRLEERSVSMLPPQLSEQPVPDFFSSDADSIASWPSPDVVYLASEPVAIPVELNPVQPSRSASIEQSIIFEGTTLNWRSVALVDVEGAPVYRHSFRLSSEIQLHSVTLLRDGLPQPLDWVRDKGRVVLHLAGGRIGRHELRFTGAMPFQSDKLTQLPVFDLEDAQVTDSQLIAQSPRLQRLELYAADGTALPAGPSPVDASATDSVVRVSSQQDAAPPTAFRAWPAPAPPVVNVLTTFERDGGQWRAVKSIRPDRSLIESEPLLLAVSQSVAEKIIVPAATSMTMRPAGNDQVNLALRPPASSRDRLTFRFELDPSARAGWQPPRIKFLNATVADEFVVVPDSFPFVPDPSAATIVSSDTWSQTQDEQSPLEQIVDGRVGYRWVSDTRSYLSRAALSGAAEVRLIETVLWRDARNASRGLTTCWLIAQQTRCELRLPWSANANLQVARWDHRSMAVKVGADENLIIRVEGLAPGSVHRLQLEWEAPTRATGAAAGELWRPHWSHLGAVEIAGVLPPQGYFTVPARQAGPRNVVLQRRIAALLGLYAAAIADVNSTTGLGATIAGEIEATFSAHDASDPAANDPLRAQWQNLHVEDTTVRDVRSSRFAPVERFSPGLTATAVCDSRTLLFELNDHNPEIDVWQIRTAPALATIAIALALALVVAARFRGWRRRFERLLRFDTQFLALFLLGAVWWFCLKVSLIGLLLMAAAIVVQSRGGQASRVAGSAAN